MAIIEDKDWINGLSLPTCMEILKGRRNAMLRDSDWTQFNDCPLTDAKKLEWATYRQELRDLPSVYPSPKFINDDLTELPDITWPTKPE